MGNKKQLSEIRTRVLAFDPCKVGMSYSIIKQFYEDCEFLLNLSDDLEEKRERLEKDLWNCEVERDYSD